jgi:hypothetical protein
MWRSKSDPVQLLKYVLPSKDDDRPAVVYWLHDASCNRPGYDGYVGVAYVHRLAARINEHRRSARFKGQEFKVTILSEDHVNSCYLYEFVLRPIPNIGWNRAHGGARGFTGGVPQRVETKLKIGDGNRGRKRPDLSARNTLMNKKRPAVTCPHCNKTGRGPGMLQWHFKNCKHRVP